jgi:type II secretory pathway predicted ATPase ExeA/outer membrane protein OmpA-like peptidoglycan-associated protein
MFESFYGLSANPFRLSADEGFRFAHRSYKKAWSYLKYALEQAEGFVLVTGRPGTGKTTLIRDIVSEIDPSRLTVVKLITNQFQSEELLRMVALELGFEAQDYNKATLLTRLSDYATQLNSQGRRIVIIVDEAQNLTENGLEELRLISNLQVGSQSLFQIFLVGQEELRGLINRPGMQNVKQRIIASTRIELLDEKQTREYIEHRLDKVGWDHDPEVNEQLYPLIQKLTHGIPREINHAVGRLLLYGALEEKHKLAEDDFWTVVKELNRERRLGIDIEDQLEAYKQRQEKSALDIDVAEKAESDSVATEPISDESPESKAGPAVEDSDEKETPSELVADLTVDEKATDEGSPAEEPVAESDKAFPIQFDHDPVVEDGNETGSGSLDPDTVPAATFDAVNDSSDEHKVDENPQANLRDHDHLDLPEIHIEGQGDVAEEVKTRLLTDVDDLFGEKKKLFSWRLLFYPLVVLVVVLLIMQPDPDALLSRAQQVWGDFNKNFIQKPKIGPTATVLAKDSTSKNIAEVESKEKDSGSSEKVSKPEDAVKERVKTSKRKTEKVKPAARQNSVEQGSQEIKLKQHYFLISEGTDSGLTRQSQLRLEAAIQLLEKYPTTVLKLTGLTTNDGSPIVQMRTALKHAESVATQVIQAGISKKRVAIEGIKPDGWESDGFDFKRSELLPDGWVVVFKVFSRVD